MYSEYEERRFLTSVDEAVAQVKKILGTAKNPRLAAEEDHTYEDKYALAEYLTNSSVAALLAVLDRMGLGTEKLQTLSKWVADDRKTVMLSFRAEDSCSLVKETLIDHVDSPTIQHESVETKRTGIDDSNSETTTTTTSSLRVVRKVKRFHWKVDVNYVISAYPGTDIGSAVELQSRSTSVEIITSAGMSNDLVPLNPTSLIPPHTVHTPIEVNITWLLQNLDRETGVCQFAIDRKAASCKTPRRNEQVEAALNFQHSFAVWSQSVVDFYARRFQDEILSKRSPIWDGSASTGNPLDYGTDGKSIFRPLVPVMESGSVLTPVDIGSLMDAHSQSLNEMCLTVAQMFPTSEAANLATTVEATIIVLCNHAALLFKQFRNSINYIEGMLTKQLIQAIGKEVKAPDFDIFMRFHNQKLFEPSYAPRPFTYSIRQPNRYPDGILSIESVADGLDSVSVETIVRHIPGKGNPPFLVPVNSATCVEITGDRFLHGWIQHRFGSLDANPQYKLVARARQFCSFLLIVGNIAGKDKFSPRHAIILQNKDEVLIPLLTEVLPTAAEFKDAIASLSPEQQDFARAYREMQLESSVFGVCVIQLKPQLEKLLGLPTGALTKEIQLTQDLMSLFVEYQIPSDLLSFDGDPMVETGSKLASVKGHVKAVMDVIVSAKEKQIMEEERKAEYRVAKQWALKPRLAPPQLAGSCSFDYEQAFGSPPLPKRALALGSAVPVYDEAIPSGNQSFEHLTKPQSINKEEILREDVSTAEGFDMIDDFTMVPKLLDAKVEKYDEGNSLKSTIIKAGTEWQRLRQENLLCQLAKTTLSSDEVGIEKNKAFDLLDAISRSGTLSIDCAELHVIVALSQCFEKDVIGTVIQDNSNPIEKAERSSLIVGTTIHNKPSQIILHGNINANRLGERFPALFGS